MIEYTLLVAFVALSTAALFYHNTAAIKGIWSKTDSQLILADRGNGL